MWNFIDTPLDHRCSNIYLIFFFSLSNNHWIAVTLEMPAHLLVHSIISPCVRIFFLLSFDVDFLPLKCYFWKHWKSQHSKRKLCEYIIRPNQEVLTSYLIWRANSCRFGVFFVLIFRRQTNHNHKTQKWEMYGVFFSSFFSSTKCRSFISMALKPLVHTLSYLLALILFSFSQIQ